MPWKAFMQSSALTNSELLCLWTLFKHILILLFETLKLRKNLQTTKFQRMNVC